MKSNFKKKLDAEISKIRPSADPLRQVKDFSNESDLIIWEKPYLSSQNVLSVDDSIFGYQFIIQAHKKQNKSGVIYYALSRVKIFPKIFISQKGDKIEFKQNPAKCISQKNPDFVIKWKEAVLKIPVLNEKDLFSDLILQRVLCQTGDFIKREFIPEIEQKLFNC